MTRTTWYLAIVALMAVYSGYAFLTVDRRGDEEQLRSLVESAATAVQDRSIGGAIGCVSRSYKDDNGLNYDRLRLLAAQAMRMEERYTARAEIRNLSIDGAKATVDIHASVIPAGGGKLYDRDVTLILRKEPARHMLVAPVKVWRVVSTKNLGLEYGI